MGPLKELAKTVPEGLKRIPPRAVLNQMPSDPRAAKKFSAHADTSARADTVKHRANKRSEA